MVYSQLSRIMKDQAKCVADIQAVIPSALRDYMTRMAEIQSIIPSMIQTQMNAVAGIENAMSSVCRNQVAQMADIQSIMPSIVREQMARIADVQAVMPSALREQMACVAKFHNIIPSVMRDQMAGIAKAQAAISFLLRDDMGRIAEIQAAISSTMRDQMRRISDVAAFPSPTLQDELRRICEVSAFLKDVLPSPALECEQHIEVTADTVATVEDLLLSEQFQSSSIGEKLDFLVQEAKRQHSLSRKDFVLILLNIVICLILNWTTSGQLWQWITAPKIPRDATRAVRRAAAMVSVTHDQARVLRIVAKRSLPLLVRPRHRSAIIGHLPLGKIVQLLGKRGKWSNIAFDNIAGWTRSKYLKRLNTR